VDFSSVRWLGQAIIDRNIRTTAAEYLIFML